MSRTTEFSTKLAKFLTPENIEHVQNTGNVLSELFVVPFREIDFREKGFIGTNVSQDTIRNSDFNRDLNYHNNAVLADKIRYALEIMAGCASVVIFPVSYIWDLPLWKQGGQPHLYLKDRGHTTYILSHPNLPAKKIVWKMVLARLEENNCRGSDILMQVRDNIKDMLENSITETFTILDVTTKQMVDDLMNKKVAIEVSIESLDNHRIEIINLNNAGNPWSTHMYGQIVLQSLLAKDEDAVLDLDAVYSTVSKLPVFLAERTFLSGIRSTIEKHAGHEDETLFFYLGCVKLQQHLYPKAEGKEMRYKFFEKTDKIELRQDMYRILYEQKVTTADLQALARNWARVAETSRWDIFRQRIETIIELLQENGYEGSIKNFTDIVPVAPRAALRWFDMISTLKGQLNWGSDWTSLTNELINEALTLLAIPANGDPMDNPHIKNLKNVTTGRSAREKYFYRVLHDQMVTNHKSTKSARESKDKKLLELRAHLAEHGFNKRTFDVIDRKRESVYTVTTVNLMNGKGFELGHKVAGHEFTDDNTFLQFPNDNRFNSARNCHDGYWIEYGSWVQEMKEQNPEVDEDAFEDTLTFCTIMADRLI